ncbi:MAG: hypothetical protein ACLPX7_26145 [Xanthobacteraceae bacterium]
MTWIPIDGARHPPETESSTARTSHGLRIVGTLLRTAFIIALLAVTVRVALPQNETIWTAYETPGDLIRMALGLVVCVWIGFQLFRVPKDAQAYRTWLYLGLTAVPFAMVCVLMLW